MFRNPLFRRFVAATLMLLGPFAQFQTVFACKLVEDKPKPVCCCDESGGMPDMSMGCDTEGSCQDQAGPMLGLADCCEVSYAPLPGATATAPEWHSQKVLLLDAPQPPPIPASFTLVDFSRTHPVVLRFNHASPPPAAGSDTYLVTNRFRI